LRSLAEDQGRFLPYDSALSEFAALGFEYGYSVANPNAFVAWEAQFGDFADGAQVIVDTYLASAEDKWGQGSGLVLLLPHGYEGQGPDHSSARLERFLQLAAEDNMQVVVPSTPAQYFHVLRRQALRGQAKPLVVMTPKSLLRLPAARSAAAELTTGAFAEVLGDPAPPEDVRRAVFTQGKLFYELVNEREERKAPVAIVRVEQLYPFPTAAIRRELEAFPGAAAPLWVQEEPENMGAWRYLQAAFREHVGVDLAVVAREESASPATGSLTIHQREQSALLERVFSR
jgi:2-oxoglutarate dehydrogenase E1 component